MELAPRQVGRVMDLAKYLAKRGPLSKKARPLSTMRNALAPGTPVVDFARARIYIEQKRNLDKARDLLSKYLREQS